MLSLEQLFAESETESFIEQSLSDQAKGMAASQILVIAYAVKRRLHAAKM